MNIADQLQSDMKDAMRGGDKQRLGVIRMARAALQTAQQDTAKQRYDAAVKEIEQRLRKDSAIHATNDPQEALDTAIQNELAAMQLDPRAPLTENEQETVIAQEIKRRYNAAEVFRKGGADDRAQQEEAEAKILSTYLPQQLSADELRPQVAAIIAEQGLSGPSSMGKLMGVLTEQFKGRAENRVLSQLARELLTKS